MTSIDTRFQSGSNQQNDVPPCVKDRVFVPVYDHARHYQEGCHPVLILPDIRGDHFHPARIVNVIIIFFIVEEKADNRQPKSNIPSRDMVFNNSSNFRVPKYPDSIKPDFATDQPFVAIVDHPHILQHPATTH